MAEPQATFSESWYRIANQKLSLRQGVAARRQTFRGQRWIILENAFNNQFFRLRPEAWAFVGRLRPDRTVEQVWQECVQKFPDETPGQEAVIQLLGQLYQANLLLYEQAADTAKLFERFEKTRKRETRARLLNIMFARLPLFDPDALLNAAQPYLRWLFSPLGALLWPSNTWTSCRCKGRMCSRLTISRSSSSGLLSSRFCMSSATQPAASATAARCMWWA